ncbi:MAG: hypothetical protein NVSMB52_19340 [Chloroflexota bacterium]
MRIQKRLLFVPAALLLAGASGIGYVHASSTPHRTTISAGADASTADVQPGGQTAPDVAGAAAESKAPESAKADPAGWPDVQQGDQTGPDTGK